MITESKLARSEYWTSPITNGVRVTTWLEKPRRWYTRVDTRSVSHTVAVSKTPKTAVRAHNRAMIDARRLYLSAWAPEKYQGERRA